jgi:hypothetical protein
VATDALLVGYAMLALCAVICVPGCGCIGAYRIGPVCIVYGTTKELLYGTPEVPSAGVAGSRFEPDVAGPVVVPAGRAFMAAITVAGSVPVMEEREKRGE